MVIPKKVIPVTVCAVTCSKLANMEEPMIMNENLLVPAHQNMMSAFHFQVIVLFNSLPASVVC